MFLKNYTLNQLLNTWRYKRSSIRDMLRYGPLSLSIAPTSRCNLRCEYCPYHSPLVSKIAREFYQPVEDMSFQTFKRILNRFPGTLCVDFIGSGEPLLNKNIFEMIGYSHTRKIETHLVTNGVVMDVQRIVHSKLDAINVSLPGFDSKSYRRVSGGSDHTFHKVLKKVRELTRMRQASTLKSISISFLVHQENFQQLPKMIALGEALGIDTVFFQNFLPFEVFYPGMQVNGLGCGYKPLYTNKMIENDFLSLRRSSRVEIFGPILLKKENNERNCILPFVQLITDSAGNVSACPCNYPEQSVRLFKDKNVWNHKILVRRREALLNSSLPLPAVCEHCFNRFFRRDGIQFGGIMFRPPL